MESIRGDESADYHVRLASRVDAEAMKLLWKLYAKLNAHRSFDIGRVHVGSHPVSTLLGSFSKCSALRRRGKSIL